MPIGAIFWAMWILGFFLGGWRVYQHTDGFDMIVLGFIFWFLIGLLGWNAFGSPIEKKD